MEEWRRSRTLGGAGGGGRSDQLLTLRLEGRPGVPLERRAEQAIVRQSTPLNGRKQDMAGSPSHAFSSAAVHHTCMRAFSLPALHPCCRLARSSATCLLSSLHALAPSALCLQTGGRKEGRNVLVLWWRKEMCTHTLCICLQLYLWARTGGEGGRKNHMVTSTTSFLQSVFCMPCIPACTHHQGRRNGRNLYIFSLSPACVLFSIMTHVA